jgi:hypothetical protein
MRRLEASISSSPDHLEAFKDHQTYRDHDPMASDGLKTTTLELEGYRENAGTLRTDIIPSAGTSKGPGFSVDFKVIYEVHGGFEATDRDNASFLVIRILPFPKDDDKQFLWFSVKLSVLVAGGGSASPTRRTRTRTRTIYRS